MSVRVVNVHRRYTVDEYIRHAQRWGTELIFETAVEERFGNLVVDHVGLERAKAHKAATGEVFKHADHEHCALAKRSQFVTFALAQIAVPAAVRELGTLGKRLQGVDPKWTVGGTAVRHEFAAALLAAAVDPKWVERMANVSRTAVWSIRRKAEADGVLNRAKRPPNVALQSHAAVQNGHPPTAGYPGGDLNQQGSLFEVSTP